MTSTFVIFPAFSTILIWHFFAHKSGQLRPVITSPLPLQHITYCERLSDARCGDIRIAPGLG
jgi:hypothetical protein